MGISNLDLAMGAEIAEPSNPANKPGSFSQRSRPLSRRVTSWLAMVATLGALCIAISGQSYWIDEANTAWRAAEPHFGTFLARMVAETGSDAQMPFFLVAIWAWEKIAGDGEIALRVMNLFWLIPGLYIFAKGRIDRLLVAGTSAFLWYYIDEARPYGMQIGASLMVFGLLERAVVAASDRGAEGPLLSRCQAWLLAFGLIALAGSSLLGAIWAAAAVAAAACAVSWRSRRLAASHLIGPSVLLVLVLAPLGLYYLWTVIGGAGGTKVATTDARTLVFSAYELFGFAGLGPGRTDLRTGEGAIVSSYVVALASYAILVGAVTPAGLIHAIRNIPPRTLAACAIAFTSAAALILMAGYILHWRVVGRHLAPAIAVVLALQAAGVALLWRRPAGKLVVLGFLMMALASGASIRFAPRHAKDDYRSAAGVVRSALTEGDRVWWNADALGALVYRVPLGRECGSALYVSEPRPGFASILEAPTLIVTSKSDIYDPEGVLAAFLSDQHFQITETFQAFQIWRRVPSTGPLPCR
ncbi:hypothetical protein [Rhizobium mesosinicum]|uniref:Glycosyltransferase RgtA/B/C/D-like domain-containing protein n=1 Tax=Rhizobium mesosinicum TaxID=335017 RepID=A0ABS7GSJ4_9HYPH|nr:hypothetical protein [Rhizobium mesosinicum]MBW9052880.1 hypothetical protein [Rhizobium mesosinicum]